jgi:hypothetical protein
LNVWTFIFIRATCSMLEVCVPFFLAESLSMCGVVVMLHDSGTTVIHCCLLLFFS